MLNVVAVRGRLSRPAEERILPSGDRVMGLELTVRRDAEKAESVPVSWRNAPASALVLDEGEEVLVVGHVARRFFRTGGATQSRTEVVARTVIPTRFARRVETALAEAASELEAAIPDRRPAKARRAKKR
jgi:single-strand DNA-binding protein